MPRIFNCNLHTHTCLSPCGDLDMHPRAIVTAALASKLNIIAITDHNASENVQYVQKAAMGTPLVVIPGMEVTTREEAHVLALFEDLESLYKLQEYVYTHLKGTNDKDVFGYQAIVDEIGEVKGFNEKLLVGATDISINDIVKRIHKLGGLAVAAHIDRSVFSVISQLGFIPEDITFDALEISRILGIKEGRKRFPELASYTFVTSADAHFIEDLGKVCIQMYLEEATLPEIRMALKKEKGRYVLE